MRSTVEVVAVGGDGGPILIVRLWPDTQEEACLLGRVSAKPYAITHGHLDRRTDLALYFGGPAKEPA